MKDYPRRIESDWKVSNGFLERNVCLVRRNQLRNWELGQGRHGNQRLDQYEKTRFNAFGREHARHLLHYSLMGCRPGGRDSRSPEFLWGEVHGPHRTGQALLKRHRSAHGASIFKSVVYALHEIHCATQVARNGTKPRTRTAPTRAKDSTCLVEAHRGGRCHHHRCRRSDYSKQPTPVHLRSSEHHHQGGLCQHAKHTLCTTRPPHRNRYGCWPRWIEVCASRFASTAKYSPVTHLLRAS